MGETGNFGKLSTAYEQARPGTSPEAVDYIVEQIKDKSKPILDLGCGTGIPTRQLAEAGLKIIGADIDEEMITKAKAHNSPNIEYTVSDAKNLPFNDHQFEAVTSIGAFQWFNNPESIKEIRRVLEEKGKLIVVNKRDHGTFAKDYSEIFGELAGKEIPYGKKDFNPAKSLEDAEFNDVTVKRFDISYPFNLEQYLLYTQSVANWHEVPEDLQEKALEQLTEHFHKVEKDGFITREMNVFVTTGIN